MWRSDQWKDYELIDCGRGEKLALGRPAAGPAGSPGHLEHSPHPPRLEAERRPLRLLLLRRRAVAEQIHAGALDSVLWQPHLQHQAHELQAHRTVSPSRRPTGTSPKSKSAGPDGLSRC